MCVLANVWNHVLSVQVYVLIGLVAYTADRTLRLYRYNLTILNLLNCLHNQVCIAFMHTRCDWGSLLCTALLLPRLGSDGQAPITNADCLVLQASPVGDNRARCSYSAGQSSGAEVEEAQKHQAVARPTV